MKLTDLDPRWIIRDGKRIGFTFIGPKHRDPRNLQSCFLESPPISDQLRLFAAIYGADEDGEPAGVVVQMCTVGTHWKITSGPIESFRPEDIETASFDTLNVHPSLNGEAGGNWHGFITNGEIVGGL